MVKQWNGLLGQVIESPYMEVLKTQLFVILGNLL